jgi:hypothetical protein
MSNYSRLFATLFRKLVMKRTLFSISSGPTFHLTKGSPSPCPTLLSPSLFEIFVVCKQNGEFVKMTHHRKNPYICNKQRAR